MIHTVVFTKDRAMQLDALLRSIKRFAPQFIPTLFYMTTYPDSTRAYDVLRAEHPGCRWVPQVRATFARDLLRCMDTELPLCALFCDDDVFFGTPEEFTVEPGTCYSLRFGDGVGDGCSPGFQVAAAETAAASGAPASTGPAGPGPETRGYALAGNVHLTRELQAAVELVATATGPNTLEVGLNTRCARLVEKRGRKNCVLSIPHNLVQDVFLNPNMGGSAADLNKRYLAGDRIDLDAMDFSNVIDAHQCIPYQFKSMIYPMPNPEIGGWMEPWELQWLYTQAWNRKNVVEIGSWFGRSAHALCSSCPGTVTAVDTFRGSPSCLMGDHSFALTGDVYAKFWHNVGHFRNLSVLKMDSVEAALTFADGSLDMIFIDADHETPNFLADLEAWRPKLKPGGLFCGHDYGRSGLPAAFETFYRRGQRQLANPVGSIWVEL